MIKPLKRDKNLVKLSHDHHDGLLVSWKVRQGIAFNVPKAVLAKFIVHEFDRHLADHFTIEKTAVFIHLPAADPLRITAEYDHQALRAMINTLREGDELATIESFIKKLDTHIRFEERTLFTHLQEVLTSDELQEVGRHLEATPPDKSPNSWTDQFWLKQTR